MNTKNTPENWSLENSYATLPDSFFTLQKPVPVVAPQVVLFNSVLAEELNLEFLKDHSDFLCQVFSGNQTPPGAKPLAQAYAGHQFGYFNMLGDGRAILLGEQMDQKGRRIDIQLKGSGQTPYSRRGDGRATLYSMLREYLISESMHALHIPTTRSLAVVSTGEKVYRENPQEGGILTRTAQSHLRVGTFEYVKRFCSKEDLQALTNYTIERHYPEIENAENPPLELLKSVMEKQTTLVVDWMRVGFIHGVMNTDNMTLSGETIDYGPCAFMNAFHPQTVFSSIDTEGRYSFANQSYIVQWNLTVFANTLLPLIAEDPKSARDQAQAVIDQIQEKFKTRWYEMMLAKLGISQIENGDQKIVDELVFLMEKKGADYTQTFLALQEEKELETPLFQDPRFQTWKTHWRERISSGENLETSLSLMQRYNPQIIPRNHWVENVLAEAVAGNLKPFEELFAKLSRPYDPQNPALKFEKIPPEIDENYQTFCGT